MNDAGASVVTGCLSWLVVLGAVVTALVVLVVLSV
jgi:hypothetical protein